MMRRTILSTLIFIFSLIVFQLGAQDVKTITIENGKVQVFQMSNECITLKVVVRDNRFEGDSLIGNAAWMESQGASPFLLYTDGGFGIQFTWTDWQAPKKIFNADNPVIFGKNDMDLTAVTLHKIENGGAELVLTFHGNNNPLLMKMTYRLEPGTFYFKRKIAVSDTVFGYHFLEKMMALDATVTGLSRSGIRAGSKMFEESSASSTPLQSGTAAIYHPDPVMLRKAGDFGQPVALVFQQSGAFFGLEYPASENRASLQGIYQAKVQCSKEYGMKVGKNPVESDWTVEALVPSKNVKDWFFRYVDAIRVAPARPYTLYNSWYDLRSPEYPKVEPNHVMNEKNVFDIIGLFRKNMIDKHNIHLDAFVLDDGWDVYQSDWMLRKDMFPQGLKPISDTLKKMGTDLGIWFGPTGGYSFRMKRVDWMKNHGYEVVGKGRDYAMMCLGGKNYSYLFNKRVTDFTRDEGIAYFKWDGIQFSCSEADHGHPVGIYSRTAILDSLIAKCNAVRAINPATYLNITSGTWLSPWWVKYANQIWMQGADYGYADVPSIS
jgi:hypothetical protein